MKKIIILGAGITGLSAAWKLSEKKHDVLVIDKDHQVGGLAKTIKFNNNYVDIGPHSFFSEDKEIFDTVKSLFDDNPKKIFKVERSVKMFFMNHYVDYPLSAKSILFQMGPIIPILCFLSFLKSFTSTSLNSILNKQQKNIDQITIKEWATNNFGSYLYNNFFKPYTEQFWKLKTEDLSHRVIPASKKLDFAKTLKHLFINKYLEISKREPGSLNLVQRESLPTFYPEKGFGVIAEKIAEKIKSNGSRINLSENITKVKKLNDKSFEVITNKESYKSDIIISTLPLDNFIKITEPFNENEKLINHSKELQYLALVMVYLIIKKKNILGCQYCYFLNRPYNRVSNLNSFSEKVSSSDRNIISLEISCHKNSEMWNRSENEIYHNCLESLKKDKLLSDEDILEWKVIKVPNVYPIYKINYEKNLNFTLNEINKVNNLYSIGRLGQFYYGDIDQMMRLGFDVSKKILKN